MIVTAGGIDSHIHFIWPQRIDEALMSGIATMLGGGTGPATGTDATTCTPGPWHIQRMLEAADALPMNLGFFGKGKVSLPEPLREKHSPGVVPNDVCTAEDARFLVQHAALPQERILGVETGGCPHTAIREDASINLEAVARLTTAFPDIEIVFVESGGDNLAATFSPELSDLTIYVIDVAAGDKIPRKGGPGITRSDLLVINKTDLAPMVGASLEVMARDSRRMRGERPFVFSNMKTGQGLAEIIDFIEERGLLS